MGYVENIKSIMQWGNSFERQDRFPLDRTDLHISYDDAVLYAKGDGSDSRGLGTIAYVGQTITVWGLNEKGVDGVWVYSLVPHTPVDENDTTLADLQPVGSGAAPETSNNYSSAVELSEDLTAGQLIYVNNEEDVTVGEATQTYKKGWYIVNAPGSISALDTSTGASDEIGALTNRVADLESNRVLSSDFEAYKGEVSTALDGKVSNDAFDTYKGEVTGAIGEVSTALDTYKGEVSTALDGKVGNDAFDTYKGEVSTALDGKASTDALNTLEGKVDTDIQNLTNLVSDYSGTLGDVDDRLVELEEFVDSHIYHEFIPISDIEGLFGTQTEE